MNQYINIVYRVVMVEDSIETSEIQIFWFLAVGPSASSRVTGLGVSRGQMNN